METKDPRQSAAFRACRTVRAAYRRVGASVLALAHLQGAPTLISADQGAHPGAEENCGGSRTAQFPSNPGPSAVPPVGPQTDGRSRN